MTKPVTVPNAWAATVGSTTGAALDANFTAVLAALNDPLTYSNYVVDVGAANAYVVTLSPAPTAYTAGLRIEFKAVNANTGASTINANALGIKSIVDQGGNALLPGAIAAGQIVIIEYDGTNFQMVGESGAMTLGGPINTFKGADIASAATTNIGAATGNYVNITGTTTITAFDTVQAGVYRVCIFAGILTLTYNATSLILPSRANITTTAGDAAVFYSLGGGNWICIAYQKADGSALSVSFDPTTSLGTRSFGSIGVVQAKTTYLASLGTGYGAANDTEANCAYWPSIPITLKNLRVRATSTLPAAQTATFTVRVNGVATALTAQITNASGTSVVSDTADSVSLGPGDYYTIQIVTSATAGTINYVAALQEFQYGTTKGACQFYFNTLGTVNSTPSALLSEPTPSLAASSTNVVPLALPSSMVNGSILANSTGTGVLNTKKVTINAIAKGNIILLTGSGTTIPQKNIAGTILCLPADQFSIVENTNGLSSVGSVSFNPVVGSNVATPGLLFFSADAQAQNTTAYANGYNPTAVGTTEINVQLPVTAGVIKNLRVVVNGVGGVAQTATYTVRVNGVATTITGTINTGATTVADLVHTASVAANDLVSVQIVLSATTGTVISSITLEHTSS